MFTVTHKRVPVIRLPKLTTPSKEPVRLLRCVLLPTLQNFRHRCGIHFEQRVNVIRHYDPCAQVITLTVEESHRIFADLSNLWATQMTFAPASVEISLQFRPALPVVLNFPEMLPFGTKRFRKGIGKAKRDELRQPRFIAMWQIATLIPTAKAALGVFYLWR